MRLFHNSGAYPTYLRELFRGFDPEASFADRMARFFADRYGACHLLKPVSEGDSCAFYVNGDDEVTQRAWARENGLKPNVSLHEIVAAQVEQHRSEVFYNQHPMRFGAGFVERLPSCVRLKIAWRAAPSAGLDLTGHDVVVCNFPMILEAYKSIGLRVAYFFPSHDPEMDKYAQNRDRPIDVLFVGGYSRHHKRRSQVLEAVAELRTTHRVEFCLDRSRLVRVAETPLGLIGPLRAHRRPLAIRGVSHDPVFGRALYERISRAKIVLNGAVDMAGADRGNMRCWEAMGCGSLLISDAGAYPAGMVNAETMITYRQDEVVDVIRRALDRADELRRVAAKGHEMVARRYSKDEQWRAFEAICSAFG